MNLVGFRELRWHNLPNGLSIHEATRPLPHPDEERIGAYLRAGKVFSIRPMVVPDFLMPERTMASASNWHTDGEWIWPTDLVYYVVNYHTDLPLDFVKRMASTDWLCPTLTQDQLGRVVEWWLRNR
jgi:hypothetical protein